MKAAADATDYSARSSRGLVLLGSALLTGWVLVEVPKQGVLWHGLFIAGLLLGAAAPKYFLPLSLALAVPQVISSLVDPLFATRTLRFIALGLGLAVAVSGASTGRLTRRLVQALRQAKEAPTLLEVLRSPAATLVWLSASSWALSAEAVLNILGGVAVFTVLLLAAFVVGSALPGFWFEIGLALALPLLLRGIFSDSNLLPFMVFSSVLSTLQLVGAALAGRLARAAFCAARRHRQRSDAVT